MSAYNRTCIAVEIDIDYCTRTWGTSPCLAAFSDSVVRKCYNTFQTCSYKAAFNKGVKTLRFIQDTYPVKNGNYMPILISATGNDQEVNIAGYDDLLGGVGKRASVNVRFHDMPDGDTLMDKYWPGRIDGTAQTNEPGYNPLSRGSFWGKFKARNPNYAGRPLRVIVGYVNDAGDFVAEKTRHYVMDTIDGPALRGDVTIVAKDALAIAEDKKALCPKPSDGRLTLDITDTAVTFDATTDQGYPASGVLVVGSEIMTFTRSGVTFTVQRAQRGTAASSHKQGDTVQLCYDITRKRGDEVIRELFLNYSSVTGALIPWAEWQAEFTRWGNQFQLTTTICKPTGVTTLLGEICKLGASIWHDEVANLIRVELNHPEEDYIKSFTDETNIMSITAQDNDNERATAIELWSMQIDPTKDLSEGNFSRGWLAPDLEASFPFMFNSERTQTIYTRWLNHGADSFIKILTTRLLNRYKRAPVTYEIKIDAIDDVNLADVVRLVSSASQDDTGLNQERLTQVYKRTDDDLGSTVKLMVQQFQFDGRYGVFTENTRPTYPLSNAEQKKKGTYFVGATLKFADGSSAYQFA